MNNEYQTKRINWWENYNYRFSFSVMEVIEEEIEETIFFIKENKNNLPHTLEYHN